MAQTICVIISAAERERLQAIVEDRNRPQKHVERAGIVLASADRGPAQQVLGVSRRQCGGGSSASPRRGSRHPRWVFHFTPTSASWLNAVENFFSKMTRQRIRRSVFCSIADLQAATNAYLAEHNASPNPSSGPHPYTPCHGHSRFHHYGERSTTLTGTIRIGARQSLSHGYTRHPARYAELDAIHTGAHFSDELSFELQV